MSEPLVKPRTEDEHERPHKKTSTWQAHPTPYQHDIAFQGGYDAQPNLNYPPVDNPHGFLILLFLLFRSVIAPHILSVNSLLGVAERCGPCALPGICPVSTPISLSPLFGVFLSVIICKLPRMDITAGPRLSGESLRRRRLLIRAWPLFFSFPLLALEGEKGGGGMCRVTIYDCGKTPKPACIPGST